MYVYDADPPDPQAVLRFVLSRIEGFSDDYDAGPHVVAGVFDGLTLVAGVVFNNYRVMDYGDSIEITIATDDPRALNRRILSYLAHYPFRELKVSRLEAHCSEANTRCRRFLLGVGFTEEGRLRRGWDGKRDAYVFSMLPDECPWLPKLRG